MNDLASRIAEEHDACGVGFIADLGGPATHETIRLALGAAGAMMHRGARAADGRTGDGAGILCETPRKLLVRELARVDSFAFFAVARERRRTGPLRWMPSQKSEDVCVVADDGVVRLILERAAVRTTLVRDAAATLERAIEEQTAFGDVGRALPEIFLVYGRRIADLGSLAEPAQVIGLAAEELRGLEDDRRIAIVSAPRLA